MAVRDPAQLVELAGVAEDVDGDDPSRPLGDRRLDGRGVQVERAQVDVGEDGRRALEDEAVRARDERERRGDDLVAGAEAGEVAEEVQARGAARDGGGIRCPHALGEELLEAVDRRPE